MFKLGEIKLINIMLHYGLFTQKGNGYYNLQMFWLPSQLTL